MELPGNIYITQQSSTGFYRRDSAECSSSVCPTPTPDPDSEGKDDCPTGKNAAQIQERFIREAEPRSQVVGDQTNDRRG